MLGGQNTTTARCHCFLRSSLTDYRATISEVVIMKSCGIRSKSCTVNSDAGYKRSGLAVGSRRLCSGGQAGLCQWAMSAFGFVMYAMLSTCHLHGDIAEHVPDVLVRESSEISSLYCLYSIAGSSRYSMTSLRLPDCGFKGRDGPGQANAWVSRVFRAQMRMSLVSKIRQPTARAKMRTPLTRSGRRLVVVS